MNTARSGSCTRTTKETSISAAVEIDGQGEFRGTTGLGFLDHMLTGLAAHSRIDIALRCEGDLRVDDHHTVEDCALALGTALDSALGERRGIARFGFAYAPLDEALARVVVDLSGRPFSSVHLALVRDRIGDVACENLTHFFASVAVSMRGALHVDVLRGANDHHKSEAAFKALAIALRQACAVDPSRSDVPSTKGTLQ